jgi:hypothetical protein
MSNPQSEVRGPLWSYLLHTTGLCMLPGSLMSLSVLLQDWEMYDNAQEAPIRGASVIQYFYANNQSGITPVGPLCVYLRTTCLDRPFVSPQSALMTTHFRVLSEDGKLGAPVRASAVVGTNECVRGRIEVRD